MSSITRGFASLIALSAAAIFSATPSANAASAISDVCSAIGCSRGDRICAEVYVTHVETICPEEDMCEDYYYDLPVPCYEKRTET